MQISVVSRMATFTREALSMTTDYLSALNVGSGLDTKTIVKAIVDAERVPKENIIQKKIDTRTLEISAFSEVKSKLTASSSNVSPSQYTCLVEESVIASLVKVGFVLNLFLMKFCEVGLKLKLVSTCIAEPDLITILNS